MLAKDLILFGGMIHLGILSAGLVMTRVLNWKVELKKLTPLSEHIIWTHGAYVWLTILAFGLVSVLQADALVSTVLGSYVSAFISLFWGIRVVIQFFYFDAKPHLTSFLLKVGFHGLSICFIYMTLAYGWVAVRGLL